MMQAQPNTAAQGLIEQLQDIRPATEPAIWPPAPGWWVLAALVLALLVYLAVILVRRMKVRIRRQRLLRELDGLAQTFDPRSQPASYLAALNRLFRGVALRAFPGSNCGRLEGSDWVAFIRERLSAQADTASLEILETGPYQPDPVYRPEQLQACARQWVLKYG